MRSLKGALDNFMITTTQEERRRISCNCPVKAWLGFLLFDPLAKDQVMSLKAELKNGGIR